MKIQVKLMATLRSKLPAEQKGLARLDVEPGASVSTVFDKLGIPASAVHAVMVNDAMELDRQRPLADGDSLVILPPVAGG